MNHLAICFDLLRLPRPSRWGSTGDYGSRRGSTFVVGASRTLTAQDCLAAETATGVSLMERLRAGFLASLAAASAALLSVVHGSMPEAVLIAVTIGAAGVAR